MTSPLTNNKCVVALQAIEGNN